MSLLKASVWCPGIIIVFRRTREYGQGAGRLSDAGAVPRRREEDTRRQGGGTVTAVPRLRGPRGGAGLEVDLADVRRIDQLLELSRYWLGARASVPLTWL